MILPLNLGSGRDVVAAEGKPAGWALLHPCKGKDPLIDGDRLNNHIS